ncbi:MAG: sensor histidine kinase [Clostridiales bacterium]|nr:sensor histidine kinase [Clostridiales bacterium]
MPEIAMHLLDLVQNSIQAGAKLIRIILDLSEQMLLTLTIMDDGCGMDLDTAREAQSPFGTSRRTRKVGLGIPLTKESALATGGTFSLQSEPGSGTTLTAVFNTRHIDCPPLGKLGDTLVSLILANPNQPEFEVHLSSKDAQETLDTRQIKETLGPVPLTTPDVALWLTACLNDMTENTLGGITS